MASTLWTRYTARWTANVKRSPVVCAVGPLVMGFVAGMNLVNYKRSPEPWLLFNGVLLLGVAMVNSYFVAKTIRELLADRGQA